MHVYKLYRVSYFIHVDQSTGLFEPNNNLNSIARGKVKNTVINVSDVYISNRKTYFRFWVSFR